MRNTRIALPGACPLPDPLPQAGEGAASELPDPHATSMAFSQSIASSAEPTTGIGGRLASTRAP